MDRGQTQHPAGIAAACSKPDVFRLDKRDAQVGLAGLEMVCRRKPRKPTANNSHIGELRSRQRWRCRDL